MIDLDRLKTTFGMPPHHEPLPPLVNPRKTREQVETEAVKGHELYKKTHESFWPGEQLGRNYFDSFNPNQTFGDVTGVDKRGLGAKRGAEDGDLMERKKQ